MKKVAIVTGVSSGIGLATANYFSSKGYIVYGIARTPVKGKDYICFSLDVNDSIGIDKTFKYIYEKDGQIDVLVNAASFNMFNVVDETNLDKANELINTNLMSIISLCTKVIPYMKKNIEAKIINVVDIEAYIHKPYNPIYQATKAALDAYSISLNNELSENSISVCLFIPPTTKTLFAKNSIIIRNEENPKQYIMDAYYDKYKQKIKNGADTLITAKAIYKVATKKKTPLRYIVGFKNKMLYFTNKILPTNLINSFIKFKNKVKKIEEEEDDD